MFNVNINDFALAQIMSATLEAYLLPLHDKDTNRRVPVETYGSLFGVQIKTNCNGKFHDTTLEVGSASVHAIAERCPDSVTYSDRLCLLHRSVHRNISPANKHLGDFHSHPYRCGQRFGDFTVDLRAINRWKLYRFSGTPEDASGDFSREIRHEEIGYYNLGLVVTLYKMRTGGTLNSARYHDYQSAIEFSYDGGDGTGHFVSFRCWLKAYVFSHQDNVPVADKYVKLLSPALGMSRTIFLL